MSAAPSGIQNFSKMNDKDKSYLVKLIGFIIAAIIAGIVTGITYNSGKLRPGLLGFSIFFLTDLGLSYLVKLKFDLRDMTNSQLFRHGIVVGVLVFIFIWTVVFQFFIF